MNPKTKRAFIALPIVLIIAAGLAYVGSQGGAPVLGLPLFTIAVILAFVIQWIAFIPAYLNQTEKFFDLTGGITFILVTLSALYLSPTPNPRGYLLAALITIWAVRLASFLFLRIRAAGEDRRFRELKTSFWSFLLTWTLQGLWVSFSLAAALAAITATNQTPLGVFAYAGLAVWMIGFAIEVIADQQKSKFKAHPENKGRFINTGLWAWSRHPNYFGEIVLWVGIAIIALPALQGWQLLTLISPLFIILLLTRISGIPMLEKRADDQWGGQAEYEAYKERTSVLIPMPPAAGRGKA